MAIWLSEDKQTQLAHVMLQALRHTTEGALRGDVEQALKEIKRVLADAMNVQVRIDQQVRARLASYSAAFPKARWNGTCSIRRRIRKSYASESWVSIRIVSKDRFGTCEKLSSCNRQRRRDKVSRSIGFRRDEVKVRHRVSVR